MYIILSFPLKSLECSEHTCCWGGNIIDSCEVVSVAGVEDVGGVPLPLAAAWNRPGIKAGFEADACWIAA